MPPRTSNSTFKTTETKEHYYVGIGGYRNYIWGRQVEEWRECRGGLSVGRGVPSKQGEGSGVLVFLHFRVKMAHLWEVFWL